MALVTVGCSRSAAESAPGTPAGVHLLADAQLYQDQSVQGRSTVTLYAHVINGGDATCEKARWEIDFWPDALRKRLLSERSGSWGHMENLRPGDRRSPFGITEFDTADLPAAQVEKMLDGLTLTLQCTAPGPYTTRVLFERREGAPPPLPRE